MVPAALRHRGVLKRLITDLWIAPGTAAGFVAPRLRDRYHAALEGAVTAFNGSALAFEARETARGASGWTRMVRRNEWFQSKALEALERRGDEPLVLFSYSYAARRLFDHAKRRGWHTVLTQIDPGPVEERLVAGLHAAHPGAEPKWQPAPAEYWRHWREEVDLADRVVVHSSWSRDALTALGVARDKVVVIPLAYEPPAAAASFDRRYPDRFTDARPLRVLFLGQVVLRKGALALLDAARELRGEPIDFIVAGPNALARRLRRSDGRIRWIGSVPRGCTAGFYREADVFLFPTASDGFGLTQLEAQAWRLPVIATAHCGEVVEDGVNGVRLSEGSGAEIAAVLRRLAADPAMLDVMSRAARIDPRHRPEQFAAELVKSVP